MFTGIITNIGKVTNICDNPNNDLIITISVNTNITRSLETGCSISCNGICLTLISKITKNNNYYLNFQVSHETRSKTTINSWKINQFINLEFALRVGDELGGHMVLGHIDDVTKVNKIIASNQSWIFYFDLPTKIKQHITYKGSVTINGTSLTVNNIDKKSFSINIIPHTFYNTNFHLVKQNDYVNIEVDMISRYLEKLTKKNEE